MSAERKVDKGLVWMLIVPAVFCWFIAGLLVFVILADLGNGRPVDVTRIISPSIWAAIGAAFWYFKRRLEAGTAPSMPAVGGAIFAFVGVCMMGGGAYIALEEPGGFVLMGMGAIFTGAGFLVKKVFDNDIMGPGGGLGAAPDGKRWVLTEERKTANSTSKRYMLVDEDTTDSEAREQITETRANAYKNARDDWASGRIRSEIERSGNIWFWIAVVFSTVWAVISLLIVIFDGELPIIAVLGLFAAFPTVKAILVHLHRKKFTTSILKLDPMPPELFETVTMTVETGIRAAKMDSAKCSLVFTCVHVYEERDSDGDTSTTTETLWSTKDTAVAERRDGVEGLVLTADFKIPGDLPPSTLSRGGNGHHWRLLVHADLPGLDYRARYVLPVLQAGYRAELETGAADESDAERPWGT
ncbi:MAG: hypothetical protein AAFV19_20060 [Pseudomonadota bacterium]